MQRHSFLKGKPYFRRQIERYGYNTKQMNTWIIYSLMGAGLLLMVAAMILLSRLIRMKDAELRNGSKMELKVQALKIIMPLKVQAYERFLLFLERAQLPQLVKRVYTPGMEKGAFHLQLLQNVREEFEQCSQGFAVICFQFYLECRGKRQRRTCQSNQYDFRATERRRGCVHLGAEPRGFAQSHGGAGRGCFETRF